jgi:DNA fragmentation factor alpha subunit
MDTCGSHPKLNMAANEGEILNLAGNTGHKRPFKICNSSREGKKGIACSSLEELKSISRERFKLGPDCRVFLESDGTEVDNEEYFQFLPPQTLFMATESNEHWIKSAEDTTSK